MSKVKKKTTPENIKDALRFAVDTVVSNKWKYVHNPAADFTRNRKLTMHNVVEIILSMEGGTLDRELYSYAQNSGVDVTSSAFVQQRNKIHFTAFRDVFDIFNESCTDINTYKGFRLLAVDGSDINQYRDPSASTFITHSANTEGYNQTHLNVLYDLCNKTYLDAELQPKPLANEHEALLTMLQRRHFPEKSLLLADRGYESYNVFAHLLSKGTDFLFRVKGGRSAMGEIRNLPLDSWDHDITTVITTSQTNEDKVKGRRFIQTESKRDKRYSPNTCVRRWDFPSPYTLKFRVVRFLLESGEYETIVTSLSREDFPPEAIKSLYHMRWGIETSFRELKYNIGLNNLHCKKGNLVIQEIYAALIMYNFCSRISTLAKIKQRAANKHMYKLNFTMAIYFCRDFYQNSKISGAMLLRTISKYIEPIRPSRCDKRKNMTKSSFGGFAYRIAA